MIKCPRCQNTVDETKRTACPVCLAPLMAPGAPGAPTYTPSPGSGALPNVPPPPARPYAPPPGSPYMPPPPPAYAPPPGSPYVAPPPPGAVASPQAGPGYAPPGPTRTTLTGEVVPASEPTPNPAYSQGGYTPPPGAAPYGNGQPRAVSYNQPAPQAKSGWSWLNWRIAGGGTLGGAYIVLRLISIVLRAMHPYSSTNDYSSGYAPQSQPSYSSRSTYPTPSQPTVYTPPPPPQGFPTMRTSTPTYTPPVYQPHFQPPNMPNIPRGFSGPTGMPSGMPGRSSFGMSPGSQFGNR